MNPSVPERAPERNGASDAGRPWYRQFWPWFVVAIPAWSVTSSIITSTVAIRGADEVIVEASGRALSRTSWRDGMTAAEVRHAIETGIPFVMPADAADVDATRPPSEASAP
jgi:hypothetical protein